MRHGSSLVSGIALGLLSLTTACSGCDDSTEDDAGQGGSSGSTSQGGTGSTGTDANGSNGVTVGPSGSTGSGNPCADVDCADGFRCDPEDGTCVALTCEEADCSETEACVTGEDGGATCLDISCEDDTGCPPDQFCDGTICVGDVCTPDASHCEGGQVVECSSNGGAEVSKFECGSDAYFESTCTEDGELAFCPCQDDWDCPEFTVCDVGQCVGTGVAPTCSLPPLPFDDLLPASEIQWGGVSIADPFAHDSPFERSSQVVMTPLVINLDDDNGDGLVNERDFPEILFLTYCNANISNNGVLRAIHGGGPAKGLDFFATCGTSIWHEGDPMPADCASIAGNDCDAALLNSTAGIAAGDLDGDGLPEIVALTETRGIQILANDGRIESTSAAGIYPAMGYGNAAPAIANIDGEGFAEIVVGNNVYTLQADEDGNLSIRDQFVGTGSSGNNGQGPVPCIANVAGDARQEIIAGGTAYTFPRPPAGATSIADCAGNPPTTPEEIAFCAGDLVELWNTGLEGFCSVADVFGAEDAPPGPDNPLDGVPEVVLVSAGRIIVLDAESGVERDRIDLGEQSGGAPNVDDFDGDGFPEVGTAFDLSYKVIDFQEPSAACPVWNDILDDAVSVDGPQTNPVRTPPPGACQTAEDCSDETPGTTCNTTLGQCVCLQNNWDRRTEDDSSRVTGSSVFDFNGDGAAEVVYNDECYFRIYDGVTARVLFKEPSESRTRIEYPVIADADNDGNAEIIFPTSTESGFCSANLDAQYNAGIEMWGDPSDQWVSARRVWNEHAYHVTNVTEGGSIPLTEPESWKEWNGREYNTYRSNPRSFGVAPDLVVSGVQVSSPDATCGELNDVIEITALVANAGDLRVGPGVVVGFFGTWDAGLEALEDENGNAIQVVLQTSLEPGDSTLVTVTYDVVVHDPVELPQSVTVVVDELEQENECIEDNNDRSRDVDGGESLADLRIDVGDPDGCPTPALPVSVTNEGSAPASNIVVRIYAGDPSQGGLALAFETIAGPIEPGETEELSIAVTGFPSSQVITLWGVVDPEDTVAECDDADNRDPADGTHSCGGPN